MIHFNVFSLYIKDQASKIPLFVLKVELSHCQTYFNNPPIHKLIHLIKCFLINSTLGYLKIDRKYMYMCITIDDIRSF